MVKEFYANMMGMKDKTIYIRGKWISFSREQIDQTYNLNERKNGSKFKKLVKEPDFQKIVDLLIEGKGKWNTTRKNPHESITRGTLTEHVVPPFPTRPGGRTGFGDANQFYHIYIFEYHRNICCIIISVKDGLLFC